MERYEVKSSELHFAFDPPQEGLTTVYLASEADDVMAGASQALNNAKARIRELEKALRKIVETAAPTSHHANYCVVHRQLLGEARELMAR